MADDDIAPCTASTYLDPSYWEKESNAGRPAAEGGRAVREGGVLRVVQGLLPLPPPPRPAPLLSPSTSVFEVGCGNSQLGEELLREGVAGGITCVDLSPVAVQRMRDHFAEQGTNGPNGF
uniref:Uncharacterized protein n=1 Tax=Leersia perrieri TaxID=77586 RepID=A0A0D9XT76_9ORYZ